MTVTIKIENEPAPCLGSVNDDLALVKHQINGYRRGTSGWFYSESYDMKINDPTEFLLVMDIYLDKTGKSAGITSSCGEPVIWTTPLLTSEVREHPYAWNLLGLIVDLESHQQRNSRTWVE
jgi:hypothetical protein